MPVCAVWNTPFDVGDGAGERALDVAEELGLEQRLGQRAAVDRHERPIRSVAVLMDGARDELLARAALADDEHRRIGRGGVRDLLVDAGHRRRAPEQRRRHGVADHHRGWRRPARACSARSTRVLSSPMLNGLLTKSNAPSRTASTAFSSSPNPVTMITGVPGVALAHLAQHVDAVDARVELQIADRRDRTA